MKGIKISGLSRYARWHCAPLGTALLAALSQAGCAIHYHDAKTGTEHVWGLAHVKMRVAPAAALPPPAAESGTNTTAAAASPHSGPETAPALATQVQTLGFGLHLGAGTPGAESGISLGWDRRTRLLVPDDRALSFEWPTAALFDVRVGSAPPFLAPAPSAPASASP